MMFKEDLDKEIGATQAEILITDKYIKKYPRIPGPERYHIRKMEIVDLTPQYEEEKDIPNDVKCVMHTYTCEIGTMADIAKFEKRIVNRFYINKKDIMPYFYRMRKWVQYLFDYKIFAVTFTHPIQITFMNKRVK